jgi:hypothetical protein
MGEPLEVSDPQPCPLTPQLHVATWPGPGL